MIFAAISDLHNTNKRPKNRKDKSYLEVCYRKLEDILKLCEENQISVLVVAGDFFDYPDLPRYVITDLLNMIKAIHIRILVIPGQHDLRYHTKGLANTSLGNLIASGHITLLSPDKPTIVKGIEFIGRGWEEEITISGDVLVTHQMVTRKGPLWPGHEDFISAPALLHKYKNFHCVISGDNHIPHSFETKVGQKQIQINCGSVMRSKKDQINHKPMVWLIDTNDWEYQSIPIPIDPAKDVFDFAKIELEETKQNAKDEAQEKIDAFIDSFDQPEGERIEFKSIVKKLVKEIKPKQSVVDIINNIMETVS